MNLRRRRAIEETRAATNRRFNSPLTFLKTRASDLGLERTRQNKDGLESGTFECSGKKEDKNSKTTSWEQPRTLYLCLFPSPFGPAL